ncbi:MAG: efflux RND transporter permease subunit [Thiotrichales bacterium]|jgi:multidrug efflux pump subunit AcrB|nr:efflux RND transporter permease subunit [Thiotrichales bacterium]MBT4152238.1 efflux RND transporter permease subunit [Thiotrichales bacterium]MBT4261176.1 efflux RND transporter permease subunit [Thiotrichales bacterium]MBT4573441.1 efflux RND transporter permease subunit [Thiotrichales bacterium]MBT6617291.1 efflux RND transporter permease subunit [Thiotrichales bacterium]
MSDPKEPTSIDQTTGAETTVAATTEPPQSESAKSETVEISKDTKVSTEELTEDLGFAGRLAESFIHSPLSPLLFIAMMVVGIWGLIATPRQEDPQISVPMIDIFFPAPGLSSGEVANQIIDPFERVLSEIPKIKHVYSASDREYGVITIQFKVGEPMGPSILQVHSKIQSNLDLLPKGIKPPKVKPKEVDDVPSVTLTLWSEEVDDEYLRTLGVSVLQHLKQLPQTGVGFVTGGRSRQVRIEILPERLAGFGVSPGQIVHAVQTANTGHTVGSIEMSNKFFFVESGGFLANLEDVKQLVVGQHRGTPVFLRDVAKVIEGPEETKSIVTYSTGLATEHEQPIHNAAAVTIALAKQRGSNGVSVVNSILDEVNNNLKGYLIPDNVHVEVTRNYGESANNKVNDLLFKLFVATAAVTFLVWLSLGIKPSIVVLLTIPVVLVGTVFMAMLMGYTIDRVSLFALIFSIGFLVDNAIVIVENIYRRWLMAGSMDTKTAVDAVREVGNPTVLATYTVVAALIPMGFVSGMMGPYMEPIPALGSVAMVLSLFAALVFAPWLAMRIAPTMEKLREMEERDEKIDEKMDRFFRSIITTLATDKTKGRAFLIALIISFFAAMYMFYNTSVPVKMLPFDNKSSFSIVVDMKDGTALPTTANFTQQISEEIADIEEIIATQSYIGTAQPFDFNGLVRHYYLRQFPWQAEIAIQLTDKGMRDRTSHQIASAVRKQLEQLEKPEGTSITVVEMPPGPPVLQTVVAEIHGPDAETRRKVADDMTRLFRESERISDVDNLMRSSMETWHFEIDREKASRQGISVETINQHLAMVMGEFKATTIFQSLILEPTYIVMTIPVEKRSHLHRLGDLPIMTMDQRTIPLSELGKFVKVKRDPIIFHKDLRKVEFVVGDAVGRLGAPIYAMLDVERLMKEQGYVTPDGVELRSGEYTGPPATDKVTGFEWAGEWTVTYETFRDMGIAFAVALVAIYMLVVWAFGNFIIPAIIMSPIPLTLLGIVPGHWIMGAEFTATSMIGWIALAGIIVRNSILMVDFTMHSFRAGTPLMDAVILSAKSRTRPILITALALVLGSAVILTDPIFQGMAVSLLFGVFISTLLTLVVIPLGCISAGEKVFEEAKDMEDTI